MFKTLLPVSEAQKEQLGHSVQKAGEIWSCVLAPGAPEARSSGRAPVPLRPGRRFCASILDRCADAAGPPLPTRGRQG